MHKYFKVFLWLFLIGFVVYFNCLSNGFVWDDEEQIVNNPAIQSFANFDQILTGATFSSGGGALSGYFFRPFITLTFMGSYMIFGLNAWGFHLFQIIFHILNGFLLFLILEALTKSEKSKFKTVINFIFSCTFLIHPAISEAVSYISAVSEVMYTFCFLIVLFVITKIQTKISLRKWIFLGLTLFIAPLYKESAIVLFPLLLVFLFIYQIPFFKKLGILTISIGVLYFFIRLLIVGTPIQHPLYSPISEASLINRLLTIPAELFRYLEIIFYPQNLSISQHFVTTSLSLESFFVPLLIEIILFGGLIYLAFIFKSKQMFFGLVWFFLGFGLISNIFPLDMTIAERWLYFPFIGLVLVIHYLILKLVKEKKQLYILIVISALILTSLGVRTIIRNSNWFDGLALYNHDINVTQNSFDLENNLGVELFRHGQIDQAKIHFERSIALQPKWQFPYNNLGAVYQRQKNYPQAEALFKKTLTIGDYYLAYQNLADIYLNSKDPKETKQFIEDALKKLPNNGHLWLILSIAEYKLGNKDQALNDSKISYQLQPSEEAAYIYNQLMSGKDLKFDAQ